MKTLVPVLLALAILGDLSFSVFSSLPRIVRGTTSSGTDVTFSPAFTAAPDCVCSWAVTGGAADTDELFCDATTTTLDVGVWGVDPALALNYICVGN